MKIEGNLDLDLRELVAPLNRIAAALERIAGSPQAAAITEKPPTQTVAPAGTDMARVFSPNATHPPAAIQARRLADDPSFQVWATRAAKANPAEVPDAVVFALEFICHSVGAQEPQDFQRPEVVDAFNAMVNAFRGGLHGQA